MLHEQVNYVTYPGVVLTAACFANGRYEETAAAKCFSNLLATGFRRLEADVFWDVSRSLWSLCPVELGNADGPFTTSASVALTPLQTATQLASDLLTDGNAARDVFTALRAFERQDSEALTAPVFSTSSVSTPSITTTMTLNANPLIPTSLSSYSHAPVGAVPLPRVARAQEEFTSAKFVTLGSKKQPLSMLFLDPNVTTRGLSI